MHQGIDHPNRKNKETITLSDIFKQVNLININRTFYPKTAEHTFFFSNAHVTFSTVDHILSFKRRNKFIRKISSIYLCVSFSLCLHSGLLFSQEKKKEILSLASPWTNLEDIILSEISQKEKKTLY